MTSRQSGAAASSPEAESFFARTLVAPFLFISFLVSLFVVDRTTSAGIIHDHGHHHSSVDHETHYHSHQRKLAKQELDDAFALRGRVIAAFCVVAGSGLAVTGWLVSKAFGVWGMRSEGAVGLEI